MVMISDKDVALDVLTKPGYNLGHDSPQGRRSDRVAQLLLTQTMSEL